MCCDVLCCAVLCCDVMWWCHHSLAKKLCMGPWHIESSANSLICLDSPPVFWLPIIFSALEKHLILQSNQVACTVLSPVADLHPFPSTPCLSPPCSNWLIDWCLTVLLSFESYTCCVFWYLHTPGFCLSIWLHLPLVLPLAYLPDSGWLCYLQASYLLVLSVIF